MYTDKVIEHFRNPKNQGIIENPDGVGTVGNPTCGDVMKIYLRMKKDKIKDIKFETLGCAAAIATSSVLTELVKGKKEQEALKITKDDIVKVLGELPAPKLHCSVLAVEALKAAIGNYHGKPGDLTSCEASCPH